MAEASSTETGRLSRPADDTRPVGRGPGPLHEAALRALNYVVALAGLVLTAPLMVVIAVAIKLDSPGPVIYRQHRVGRDRRR